MTVLLKVIRVLLAGLWTAIVGAPLMVTLYVRYNKQDFVAWPADDQTEQVQDIAAEDTEAAAPHPDSTRGQGGVRNAAW